MVVGDGGYLVLGVEGVGMYVRVDMGGKWKSERSR